MYSLQTNVTSLFAQNNLRVNSDFQAQTISRLTSGYRINSSGDDAAGLAVANQFRSNVAELNQGVRNANDAVATLQIIDGGLNNISKTLDRLKTLATESATDTFSGNRTTLNGEFQALLTEITREATNIGLNSGGSYNKALSVYIGGGSTPSVDIALNGATNAVDATSMGFTAAIKVDTAANALTAIGTINTAVTYLGTVQGIVGTGENRLGQAVQLASSQITNISGAESRIRDADVAAEAANLTKAQVLQQASVAALAQANTAPQNLLRLFQ